jgi:hypothetical protein
MKHGSLALIVVLFCVVLFSSCKKENSAVALPDNVAPGINLPTDGSGYFSAVKVITSENYNHTLANPCLGSETKATLPNKGASQQLTVGSAGFYFVNHALWETGNASYDGHALPYSVGGCVIPEGIVSFNAGPSDTIVFGNYTAWNFTIVQSYDSLRDTLSASFTDNFSFPTITDIASIGTVSIHNSYTLSAIGNVSGDSVIFVIAGPKGSISSTMGPNSTSCTFTAAQMATLGTTNNDKFGLLQIVPYRLRSQTIDGCKCYLLKEACLSKYVVLQ